MLRFSWSRLSFSIVAAVTINILFGLVKLIDLLGIEFNYFYSPKVIDIVIFSPSIDLWVWAVSLLFMLLIMLLKRTFHQFRSPLWIVCLYFFLVASLVVFLIDDRIASLLAVPLGLIVVSLSVFFVDDFVAVKREKAGLSILAGITGMLIPLEIGSLSSWAFNAFNYEVPFGSDVRWRLPWIDLQLFSVLYPLVPSLFMILLYGWTWIPTLRYGLSKNGKGNDSNIRPVEKLNNKFLALGLALSLSASVFVTSYPYIHLLGSSLIGVDSKPYDSWLREMMQKGPGVAFETDKPIFNLLMYFIRYVTALSPEFVIRIMPIMIAVIVGLTVFWFARVGTGDDRLALLSSLFSAFSFQTTVSIFAYSLANWFAIAETFLLLAFLLKSSKNHPWRYMLISALLGMAVLLTHPYTWDVLMIVLIMYLGWTFLRRPKEKWSLPPLTLLVVANALFYIFYTLSPFGNGASQMEGVNLNPLTSNLVFPNFLRLNDGLGLMVSNWVGGLFGNPLMIILAVIGMFAMIDFKSSLTNFQRMMLLWVAVPSIILLIIPLGQELFFYRLVYLVPFQILAALGLHSIFNRLKDLEHRFKLNPTISHLLRILLFTLIVLFLFNYALRSVNEAVITAA